ncbi:MAG: hypothetical protein EXX96DRAFT_537882 [Benjaminiella poitrasii]|nr:MAG: hypothetical protein EXX96DRAFT_634228 [Benjaminiella poitrasii]KAI9480618.1 MAG: hypothetical protein EXX96DRAFT_537882 [Benjaminiella poitrasii]
MDHTVCASPLFDTCLPLKATDGMLNEFFSNDIYLTFDEYIKAVTASYSAPNLTRFSTISCLTSTVSLSLSEKNKAITTSPITPSLTLTNTISRSDSMISLASPLEEMYTFDVSFFEDAKTVTKSSSAPSLTLIDTILRSDSMISLSFQEDEKAITASHPIPNWMPTSNPAYANLTLDMLNKTLSPLDEVYLYGLSLCGTIFLVHPRSLILRVNHLPLKKSHIITTPITTYTNANTIFRTGECITSCEPNAGSELFTSNKRVFGTIQKLFKGIFQRNKYTTQISTAPKSVSVSTIKPILEKKLILILIFLIFS